MTLGPLEFITIEFKGNQFTGEIVPAFREAIDRGTIRIIDLLFVKKDAQGVVSKLELSEIGEAEGIIFDAITDDVSGMLSEDDVQQVADMLENNSSALLMLFEHTWARHIKQAVMNANGRLVMDYHIPAEVVQQALAARD